MISDKIKYHINQYWAIPLILTLLLSGCASASLTSASVSVSGAQASPIVSVTSASPGVSSASSLKNASFLEGEDIFKQADAMLGSAQKSILLEMYELGDKTELSLLEKKAKAGIPVLVILDGKESQSRASLAQLKANHVQVVVAGAPLVGDGGIQHAKLLVVDDQKLLIGGMNWGKGSYKNADADVYLEGESAKEAQEVFESDWQTLGHSLPQVVARETVAGNAILSGQPLLQRILQTMSQANNIDASLFELSNRELINKFEQRARAGAKVRIVLDSRLEGKENSKVIKSLRQAGVEVRSYPKNQVLHAKMLITGDTLVIGSANYSASAFNGRNHELDIFTQEQNLVSEAKEAFSVFWEKAQ